MRRIVASHTPLPSKLVATNDPLDFVRFGLYLGYPYAGRIQDEVEREEVEAIRSAAPTPGATDVLDACARTGRKVVIVSNNAYQAIKWYVKDHDLEDLLLAYQGRSGPDAMKPSPRPLIEALQFLREDHSLPQRTMIERVDRAVMVGDSLSDVLAAQAAGVRCIAYANKPGKAELFARAGADAVITDMYQLAEAL
jgi:phosphoglycolate phosphatase-like HAD superfamily hydrolase